MAKPRCYKIAFPSRIQAERAVSKARQRGVKLRKAYLCWCGAWHTTSKDEIPPREKT